MDTGSAALMGYHTVGLCIVVPGIGSGSCDIDRAPFLIIFLKFVYVRSSLEGLYLHGVNSPIIFLWWFFTNLSASDKSLSFDITTAQSYKSCHASFRKCTARFTSEPFSSDFIIFTNFMFFRIASYLLDMLSVYKHRGS